MYGNFEPTGRAFMTLRGRARVDGSDADRGKVYDSAHPVERDKDKDRKGIAIVIDLDSVDGFFGGAMLKMRR
jgi:hypothetical protein